jgi:hypothetical protein
MDIPMTDPKWIPLSRSFTLQLPYTIPNTATGIPLG